MLAGCLALVSPRLTAAQGSAAAAESLFQTGRQLVAASRFEEACPKFEESYRLNPLPGTSLNLASCYKQLGKTASAWAQFKEAAFQARKSQQPEREAAANQEIAALEPRLSKLQINAADVPGMVIRRDNQEVGRGALGIPVAIDPGPHTVEATAPGYSVWTTTVEIGKDSDLKTVMIPLLQKSAPTPPPEGPAPSTAPSAPMPPLRIAAYAVGGVGVAGLAVGAIFGILAVGDAGKATLLCPNKTCAPGGEGRKAVDAASTKALVSTLGISVGAAAVGAGVILFVVSGNHGKAEAPASLKKSARVFPTVGPVHVTGGSPFVGPDGGGLTVAGAF